MRRSGRFGPILGRGRRYSGRLVQLIVDDAASGAGEFGVIVGRKTMPTAVARNRARRVLRALYRRHRPVLAGKTVIFRIRQAPVHSRMHDLVADAEALLGRSLAGSPAGVAP